MVVLPLSRVLRAMPPLQPLGQERHRRPARPARHAAATRPARCDELARQWRRIHSRPLRRIAIAPGCFLHSCGVTAGDPRLADDAEAHRIPLHQMCA